MQSKHSAIAVILLSIAGIILLAQTVFGCVAFLGIGASSFHDIILDACLTLAFPIYVLAFWSRRTALVGLWLFFVAQWIEMCLASKPPVIINPVQGWHGATLFLGVLLFTAADWSYRRSHAISRGEAA